MNPNRPHCASDAFFACAIETCRRFLLWLANSKIPGHLVPKGEASDLVQETLLAGYQHKHQFHGRTVDDLRVWLRRILLNELASFCRRYRASCRDVAREIPFENVVSERMHPVTTHGALDEMIRAERVEAVTAAIARLPSDTQAVLVLRLNDNLAFREIGEKLGRKEDSVRKAFTRALDRVREEASTT